jgi:hypothetical protein
MMELGKTRKRFIPSRNLRDKPQLQPKSRAKEAKYGVTSG